MMMKIKFLNFQRSYFLNCFHSLWFLAVIGICFFYSSSLQAKPELLPKNVGAFQLGYRSYSTQTHNYDSNGNRQELGAPLSNRFDGLSLLEGKGGADLKKLAEQVQKYDSFAESNDSLLKQLDLGQMKGKVEGDINAQFFGLAYGITSNLSFFLGVPYVQAKVNTSIEYSGGNNAELIKSRLGQAAFDELQSGLEKAKAINAQQIKEGIESNGYKSLDEWKHEGVGDIMLGSVWGDYMKIHKEATLDYVLQSTFYLPTGYTERADTLTDVNIGNGYYALQFKFNPELSYKDRYSIGGWTMFQHNFASEAEKRVPENDEALVDASRTTSLDFQPGADMGFGTNVGFKTFWTKGKYNLGIKTHNQDRYSGSSVGGNLHSLSTNSKKEEVFHEISFAFDTSKAFKKKIFLIPMIVQLGMYQTLSGKNVSDITYYELSFSSFFKGL